MIFGTGLSSGWVGPEQFLFGHVLAPGQSGAMTHFWATYPTDVDDGVLVRYWVDGETTPSIEFRPSLACGVGSYDVDAPWGTKWFGKGSKNGGWHWNFRIPFQKSILVSVLHTNDTHGGFYMIVRGAANVAITYGGVDFPSTARLLQFRTDAYFQPIEYITLANVTSGRGIMFMHTLAVESGNMNFLEGCFHLYTHEQRQFPGVVLSTGTEDFFDSAWYFDAGPFHLPVSGFTHIGQNSTGGITWSAYRFHEMDPLQFTNGFAFQWRNGDSNDPAGMKCFMETGGGVVGSPTVSHVMAYVWVYVW